MFKYSQKDRDLQAANVLKGQRNKKLLINAIRRVKRAGHEIEYKSLMGKMSWYTLRSITAHCKVCESDIRVNTNGNIEIIIDRQTINLVKCKEVAIKWVIE